MSSREWEGNGVSHNARKDVKRQRASLFWYHSSGRYLQIAWCDSCSLLSACD